MNDTCKPTYSSVVKNDSIAKDWQSIIDTVGQLLKRSQTDEIKGKLNAIKKSAERIWQQNELDRRKKQEEISKLKAQVIRLQSKVEKLEKDLDTIDTGEAMKIMELHVAGFVFHATEGTPAEVGTLADMIEYVKDDENAKETWKRLRTKCQVESWTDDHEKLKTNFILYRNRVAHPKKFDLEKLWLAMKKRAPRKTTYVDDIMKLFVTVDSLMKLGVLLSDPVVCKVIQEKSKEHGELIDTIKDKNDICCYVEDLQHFKIEKAKDHLVDYLGIPHDNIAVFESITKEIVDTNGPRLGKLVAESEMEVVGRILEDPSTSTFENMNDTLSRRKENVIEQWMWLTGGKEWTKSHSKAMKKLKGLLPTTYLKKYDDLPLNIAQLLIPDVLEEQLWDAGTDILEIFVKWERKKKNN